MSTLVIEKNFLELQKRTTHVLADQKVLISEQEQIDIFLDKINAIKKDHSAIIKEYSTLIDGLVGYLCESRPIEELAAISECIQTIINVSERLISSFNEGKFKDCFHSQLEEYNTLVDDIREILLDIENRISGDKEMEDLLADF